MEYSIIIVKNLRSSYDLQVARNRDVAVNLSCSSIAYHMAVFLFLVNELTKERNFKQIYTTIMSVFATIV